MYFQVLKNILHYKSFKQTDLASLAGVSRAAVSKWFQEGEKKNFINVETKTLLHLASRLGISPDLFLQKRENLSIFKTLFLWDFLYPDMETFIVALSQNRLSALARLVQALGFRQARFVVGAKAVKLFPRYSRYLKPARRKQLEILWPLYQN